MSSFITYRFPYLSCIRDISCGLNCWRFNKNPWYVMGMVFNAAWESPSSMQGLHFVDFSRTLWRVLAKNSKIDNNFAYLKFDPIFLELK